MIIKSQGLEKKFPLVAYSGNIAIFWMHHRRCYTCSCTRKCQSSHHGKKIRKSGRLRQGMKPGYQMFPKNVVANRSYHSSVTFCSHRNNHGIERSRRQLGGQLAMIRDTRKLDEDDIMRNRKHFFRETMNSACSIVRLKDNEFFYLPTSSIRSTKLETTAIL